MPRTAFPLVLAAAIISSMPARAADPVAEVPFPTAEVIHHRVAREQRFDGVIEAVNRSTVSAQITGRIEAIHFDVDDYVTKDSVLLQFRSPEQQARLEQAQAVFTEAQARQREADAEYARIRSVYERKLVAKSALDKATAELKAAAARLEAAQAGVAQAREQLEHTLVRAPYSGIVVARHVEVGETASVGQPLMTGLSLDALRALVEVPQSYVNRLREDRGARIYVPGRDTPVDAGVLTVFPYADPRAHTFKVRVALPPGQAGLYPGMSVKVAFLGPEEDALLVPTQAVVHRSEVTGVYVVAADGGVSLRQVRLGRALADGMTEVLSGLDAGERVALDPIRAGIHLKERAAEPGA